MKKFFVIGEKTSKSLSPTIFNHWFKKYNIKAQYNFIEIRKKNFNQKISKILSQDKVTGINVTIPFKKKHYTAPTQYRQKLKKHKGG